MDRNALARAAVIREWDSWAKSHPDDAKELSEAGMHFFTYLRKERPELLDFRYAGDKWRAIHAWLLREGRVKS
jgi:hypothetical protein